jgi:hypothetical protein
MKTPSTAVRRHAVALLWALAFVVALCASTPLAAQSRSTTHLRTAFPLETSFGVVVSATDRTAETGRTTIDLRFADGAQESYQHRGVDPTFENPGVWINLRTGYVVTGRDAAVLWTARIIRAIETMNTAIVASASQNAWTSNARPIKFVPSTVPPSRFSGSSIYTLYENRVGSDTVDTYRLAKTALLFPGGIDARSALEVTTPSGRTRVFVPIFGTIGWFDATNGILLDDIDALVVSRLFAVARLTE